MADASEPAQHRLWSSHAGLLTQPSSTLYQQASKAGCCYGHSHELQAGCMTMSALRHQLGLQCSICTSLLSSDPAALTFSRRAMTGALVQEPHARRITHYHYHAWPDHGIPAAASSLRRLCGVMDAALKGRSSGPPVVHCSAGGWFGDTTPQHLLIRAAVHAGIWPCSKARTRPQVHRHDSRQITSGRRPKTVVAGAKRR